MATIARSARPVCPACGFAVFNRRFAKCEKCQAELPASIAYTPDELVAMRQQDRVEEDKRERRIAKARADRARRGARPGTSGVVGLDAGNGSDLIDIAADLGDILGSG